MDTVTISRRYLARHANTVDLEIESAEGPYVIANGRRYIDFTSGWCVGNIGWGQQFVRRAVRGYAGPDYVAPAFDYEPWAELAQLLCENAPGKMGKCYRCTGGSEAVDLALQIAAAYTGRKKFLSVEGSYHGNTIAARSVGGPASGNGLPVKISGCRKIRTPLDEKRLKQVETILSKADVAAFVMEPVLLNLGVEIPDTVFMRGVQRLCRKYGSLFIADEVACGFGRTGKLFASEHFAIEPDIICMAKGLSGGYAGIGAVVTTGHVHDKVKHKVTCYSTFGWHPLGVEAALANVKYMLDDSAALFENVRDRSQQLRTGLSAIGFRKGGKLSMIGLAIAVDLEEERYAAKVKDNCQEEGLLVTSAGTRLVMYPPLTVDDDTVAKALRMLKAAAA